METKQTKVPGVHLSPTSSAEQNCKNSLPCRRDGNCPVGRGTAKSLDNSVLCFSDSFTIQASNCIWSHPLLSRIGNTCHWWLMPSDLLKDEIALVSFIYVTEQSAGLTKPAYLNWLNHPGDLTWTDLGRDLRSLCQQHAGDENSWPQTLFHVGCSMHFTGVHRPAYIIKAGEVQPGTQEVLREFKTPKGGDGIFQDSRSFFQSSRWKNTVEIFSNTRVGWN